MFLFMHPLKFGPIVDHAHDIIDPLLQLIGQDGTFFIQPNTGNITDPKYWKCPSVKILKLCEKN